MNFLFLQDVPFTSEDFLNKLFPNFWSFLINFIALIVLFVFLYFFTYKPVKKIIRSRKAHIEHELKDAEDAKKINQEKLAQSDKIIHSAQIKANQIIDEAKLNATSKADEIIKKADEEITLKKLEADKQIKLKEEKSRQKIAKEALEISFSASEKILKRNISEDDKANLINEFSTSVKKEKKDEQ